MSNWLTKLVKVLDDESVDTSLLNYVDDVLSWEVVRDKDPSYLELLENLGQQNINIRFEELLDRLIVDDFALSEMFPLDLSDAQAKKRYRKLIRIFHPDRGSKPQEWLNSRAEKINLAYRQFVEDETREDGSLASDYKASDIEPKFKKAKFKTKFKYRPSLWRERLGSPQQFQKKILSALLVFSLLLVFFVFWANKEPKVQTPLLLVGTGDQIDEGPVSEGFSGEGNGYIKEASAQKILQEADEFLKAGDDTVDIEYNANKQLSINSEGEQLAELDEFINELEGFDLPVLQERKTVDACHPYPSLSSSALLSEQKETKQLLARLSLRSGPSVECDLLIALPKGSKIYFDSKTQDGLWAKVMVEPDRALLGWIEMKEFRLTSTQQLSVTTKKKNKVNKFTQPIIQPKPTYKTVHKQSHINDKQGVRSLSSLTVKPGALKQVKQQSTPKYLELVEKLKLYYEVGDSSDMSDLYISSGRENEIRGKDQIRKYYRKAFSKTKNRKFDYVINSYRIEEQSTAVIKGRMSLSMVTRKNDQRNTIDAQFTILLIKLAEGFKIASFEWQQ